MSCITFFYTCFLLQQLQYICQVIKNKTNMEGLQILIGLFIFALIILALRLLGAWMLRINDVIDELKKVNENLNRKY